MFFVAYLYICLIHHKYGSLRFEIVFLRLIWFLLLIDYWTLLFISVQVALAAHLLWWRNLQSFYRYVLLEIDVLKWKNGMTFVFQSLLFNGLIRVMEIYDLILEYELWNAGMYCIYILIIYGMLCWLVWFIAWSMSA